MSFAKFRRNDLEQCFFRNFENAHQFVGRAVCRQVIRQLQPPLMAPRRG